MKRLWILLLVAWTGTAFAGLEYRFESVTTGRSGMSLSGVVEVEGGHSRIAVTGGKALPLAAGSVILSSTGTSKITVLDPAQQSYYSLDLSGMLDSTGRPGGSLEGMFDVKVENPKVRVSDLGEGVPIAGYPTHRYRTETSCQLVMTIMSSKQTTTIQTRSDIWTTGEIDPGFATFVQSDGLRTGWKELDHLLESQSSSVKGFPLKIVTTTTTSDGRRSMTSTTTTTVSDIREKAIPPSRFAIPEGYRKVDVPSLLPRP
ncbi:MAG: DUF4412 domain-containing protein [Thermoanaerobaculia bacterium]